LKNEKNQDYFKDFQLKKQKQRENPTKINKAIKIIK